MVECPFRVLSVVGLISHGGPIELFHIPASTPPLAKGCTISVGFHAATWKG